jgi:hypothetical protein
MRRTTMLVVCTLALTLCAVYATAAEPADTLKVDYFANANTAGAPDATLRLTNVGTSGGNICADIFVYDSSQELSECCSCLITPNGLLTLSVNKALTANPLTGVTLNTGTISVVSARTTAGACPLPTTAIAPTPGVRSWATHIQNSNFTITEGASQDSTLSNGELAVLQNDCYAVNLIGSGKGQCSCSPGE